MLPAKPMTGTSVRTPSDAAYAMSRGNGRNSSGVTALGATVIRSAGTPRRTISSRVWLVMASTASASRPTSVSRSDCTAKRSVCSQPGLADASVISQSPRTS